MQLHIIRKNGLVVRKDALLLKEESSFIQVVKEYFKEQEVGKKEGTLGS